MKIRAFHRLLAAGMIGLFSLPAIAQYTRDASANQKIDEAINNHYLMMEMDKAEGLLTGTIAACDDKCSPQTKAKAWMYVGIVRGSGKNDQAGAAEAFATAKGLDPAVKLDSEIASPETKETFAATAGGAAPAQPAPAEPAPEQPAAAATLLGPAPPPVGVPGDMICSPQGGPIGLNMPIPVSCTSAVEVASAFIKFQEPGSADWKKINLVDKDGQWQGTLPCEFTKTAGDLKFYVGAKDTNGEYVDQFGSKKEPGIFTIAADGEAPAFPGQAPVEACAGGDAASDCPPDFPGCSKQTATCGDLDWGAACSNSSQCKCGLLCESGQCATAPTCKADAECETGACVDGYCSAVAGAKPEVGPFKRHWLSLSAGMDLMTIAAVNDLCNPAQGFESSYGIQCYDQSGNSTAPLGTNIGSGVLPGQMRIKLGYDFAVTHHLTLGLRAGLAFLNSHPKSSSATPSSFLPVHVEGRAGWTFTSLAKPGFRPVLYVAGGLAESNGKTAAAGGTKIYKVAGVGYAAPGLTLGWALKDNMSINADVQAMLMFPTGGMTLVLHPALSFVYGL